MSYRVSDKKYSINKSLVSKIQNASKQLQYAFFPISHKVKAIRQ